VLNFRNRNVYGGSGLTLHALLISIVDLSDVSGHLHAPATLPQGTEPSVSLDMRLGGFHIRSGCCDEKTPLLLPGLSLLTWNSITPMDSSKLERVQTKFVTRFLWAYVARTVKVK
jgi:hypothetical protein